MTVDLLVAGLDHAVVGPPPFEVRRDVTIAIDCGRIVAIGGAELADVEARRRIDGRRAVAVPGFVNGHTHGAFALDRGLEPELPLDRWLPHVFAVSERVDPDVAFCSAQLAYTEMVRAGFTACVDHHYAQAHRGNALAVAAAADSVGLRVGVAATASDLGDGAVSSDEAVARLDELVDATRGSDGSVVEPWLALASPGRRESPERGRYLRAWADDRGVRTTYHFAETTAWRQLASDAGSSSLAHYLLTAELLDDRSVLAHGVWFEPGDLPVLAEHGVWLSHNPVANGYLGDGIAPMRSMLDAGVSLCLGTDGPNCSGRADPFEMMRTALILARANGGDAPLIDSRTALELATWGGARAFGDDDAGALVEGARADVTIVSLDAPHLQPVHDVIWTLVWSAVASDVRTVVIGGQVVVDDGECVTVEVPAVIDRAIAAAERLRVR